ncbi:MAG: hypothetical protein AAF441_29740, partial [Pseudomonadota bacterium]
RDHRRIRGCPVLIQNRDPQLDLPNVTVRSPTMAEDEDKKEREVLDTQQTTMAEDEDKKERDPQPVFKTQQSQAFCIKTPTTVAGDSVIP